tara:strand:- start:86471 stop:87439 length:969 start_codon:yes stop_codon:yes gene_type:complete
MKTLHKLLGLTIATLTLISCAKDDSLPVEEVTLSVPTALEFNSLRSDAWNSHIQTIQFNAEDGISFTSAKGVKLNIWPGCLENNGNPATGSTTLEYVELFEKGDMLTTNKATMGLMPDNKRALLKSGGEFYINAKQNGVALELTCTMTIEVPAQLTGGPDPAMTLWDGSVAANGDIVWEENTEPNTGVFIENNNYFGQLSEFGFKNVDVFASDPRPKTKLKGKVPQGYNYENSAMYLSFNGIASGLAQLDTFDDASNSFSEHYGQIPIGQELSVIFATEEDGMWKYAIKSVTVQENDVYEFTIEETTTGTRADFIAAINALP